MRLQTAWDSYWTRAVGGSVVLFIVLPLLVRKLGGDYAQGVYIGTGVALVWYTVETYYLRREMVRPLIISKVGMWPESSSGPCRDALLLRNIGKAPALFVRVEDLTLSKPELRVTFETVDILEEKPEEEARSQPYFGDAKVLDTFLRSLRPSSNKTHHVIIRYEDVNGTKHTSVMQMGKGGTRARGLLRGRRPGPVRPGARGTEHPDRGVLGAGVLPPGVSRGGALP